MSAAPLCLKIQAAATGLLGFAGVMAGAYGSHGLTGKVPADRQAAFLTGSHYQIMHSCAMAAAIALKAALLLTGAKTCGSAAVRCLDGAVALFAAGIIGFSGTIYCRVMGGPEKIAFLAPVGGTAIMGGWFFFAATALFL